MYRELLLASLIVLSGCGALVPGGAEPATANANVSCQTEPIPNASTNDTRRTYPPLPDPMTRETVREFAVKAEWARTWNEYHHSNTESFDVEVSSVDVSEGGGGYAVYMSAVSIDAIHNGSDGRVAASDAWAVEYFVTEAVVRRAEGNVDTDLDAADGAVVMYVENGTTTVCSPGADE
jgi:hypothetical protein